MKKVLLSGLTLLFVTAVFAQTPPTPPTKSGKMMCPMGHVIATGQTQCSQGHKMDAKDCPQGKKCDKAKKSDMKKGDMKKDDMKKDSKQSW